MKEQQYALELKKQYDKAKQEFEHPTIIRELKTLKNLKINYELLKKEVEKFNYYIELANNIKIKYWQKQWKIKPICVFCLNEEDL